jgi:hypothetical protein
MLDTRRRIGIVAQLEAFWVRFAALLPRKTR